jgi:hypothetical protein
MVTANGGEATPVTSGIERAVVEAVAGEVPLGIRENVEAGLRGVDQHEAVLAAAD